jgi:hypothetical protein
MLRISHFLDNRLTDGGEAVSPTVTILDIFHPPVFYSERERERRKLGGGSERHYRLEGGVTETSFSSLEGSQAVPASPSGKGFDQF